MKPAKWHMRSNPGQARNFKAGLGVGIYFWHHYKLGYN